MILSSECAAPLGMENWLIPSYAITASSEVRENATIFKSSFLSFHFKSLSMEIPNFKALKLSSLKFDVYRIIFSSIKYNPRNHCSVMSFIWFLGVDLLSWKEIRNPLYLTANKLKNFCHIGN